MQIEKHFTKRESGFRVHRRRFSFDSKRKFRHFSFFVPNGMQSKGGEEKATVTKEVGSGLLIGVRKEV